MDDPWLHDIMLVNESTSGVEAEPEDVDVFRSMAAACRYLEPWWVEEGHGFAFSAAGDRIVLGVENDRVVVERREPCAEGTEIVRSWLRHSAEALLAMRRAKAAKGKVLLGAAEAQGVLPTSIEGLVAYVGFVE